MSDDPTTEPPLRVFAELECNRCRTTLQLIEDGDLQDDGTIEWSGCMQAVCCGLLYAGAVWEQSVGVYDLERTHE